MTAQKKTIRLQYVRSKICTPVKHKKVVKGLGFTRLYQVVEREDTPQFAAWSPRFRTWCRYWKSKNEDRVIG